MDSESSELELRSFYRRTCRETLEKVCLLAVPGYMLVALRDTLVVPDALSFNFLLRDASLLVGYLVLYGLLQLRLVPERWAHPWTFVACAIPCIGTLYGIAIGGEYIAPGYYFFIIFLAALTALEIPWFLLCAGSTLGIWSLSVPYASSRPVAEEALTMVVCILIAGVAVGERRKELKEQFELLALEEAEQRELEAALETRRLATLELDQQVEEQTRELSERLRELQQSRESEAHLQEEARRLDRVAAVGRLAGGLGHRFNNLFTVMLGHTNLVQESPAVQADRDLVARLDRLSRDISKVARSTRSLAYLGEPHLAHGEGLSTGRLYEELEGFLAGVLSEDIQLQVLLQDREARRNLNFGGLYSLLLNLFILIDQTFPSPAVLTLEFCDGEPEQLIIRLQYRALEGALEPVPKVPVGSLQGELNTLGARTTFEELPDGVLMTFRLPANSPEP